MLTSIVGAKQIKENADHDELSFPVSIAALSLGSSFQRYVVHDVINRSPSSY